MFQSKLTEDQQKNLITGDLKKRVLKLLRSRLHCAALDLVITETGVTIADAIGPVNRLYESVDDSFKKLNGGR